MSNRKKLKRLREPTEIEYTNSEKVEASLSDQASRRRRSETMEAASVIHGGTPEDKRLPLLMDCGMQLSINLLHKGLEYILATQKRS